MAYSHAEQQRMIHRARQEVEDEEVSNPRAKRWGGLFLIIAAVIGAVPLTYSQMSREHEFRRELAKIGKNDDDDIEAFARRHAESVSGDFMLTTAVNYACLLVAIVGGILFLRSFPFMNKKSVFVLFFYTAPLSIWTTIVLVFASSASVKTDDEISKKYQYSDDLKASDRPNTAVQDVHMVNVLILGASVLIGAPLGLWFLSQRNRYKEDN